MSRKPFYLTALLAAVLPCSMPRPAAAQQIPETMVLPLEFALYQGRGAYFVSTEFANLAQALQNQRIWAPRLAAAQPAGTARVYLFANGIPGQPTVLSAVPSEEAIAAYSPIWEIVLVRWLAAEEERRLVGADDDIMRLVANGRVEITPTGRLFNGPVVLFDGDLNGNNVRLAPTLKQPEQVVSFSAGNRRGSVVMTLFRAFWAGMEVPFLSTEHAPRGVPPFLEGVATVDKIGLDKIGHGAVANAYLVLDREGNPAQEEPIFDSVPGLPLFTYSPLWHINVVRWQGTPRLLKSVSDVVLAARRGEVTVTAGDTQATFNCPVPIFGP